MSPNGKNIMQLPFEGLRCDRTLQAGHEHPLERALQAEKGLSTATWG